MTKDNTEVEIKIKLTKHKFEKVKKHLLTIAKEIKTSHHIDTYYNSTYHNFLKPKYPFEWLTLRNRDRKITLNYKHWYPEGVKNTTHCDEYETAIGDLIQTEKILKALRFKEFITIDKKRTTYNYKNKFEIAMDIVKKLGYFIEVESINNEGGIKKSHQEILEFLKLLKIRQTNTVPGGYAAEMMRRSKWQLVDGR